VLPDEIDRLEAERSRIMTSEADNDNYARASEDWKIFSRDTLLDDIGDPAEIILHYLASCHPWPMMPKPPSRDSLLSLENTEINVTDIDIVRSCESLIVYGGIVLRNHTELITRIDYGIGIYGWYIGEPGANTSLHPVNRLHIAIIEAGTLQN